MKGILVNIFGGIMKCDIIAEGIVAAAREIALKVPLVVRLEGTNVELGKEILAESGLPVVSGRRPRRRRAEDREGGEGKQVNVRSRTLAMRLAMLGSITAVLTMRAESANRGVHVRHHSPQLAELAAGRNELRQLG